MKKVALLLLSMIFALMLLSCQAVQPGGAGEGHVHTYEGQLQYNETAHFYRCTCGKAGTPEVHADINKDGVCDACGFGMDLIICEHQWVEYCDKPTTCALCGRWEWGSEPRGHEYDDEVTAPTCTEAGFTTHVCKHCGYTHVDTIVEALGHTPVVDDAVAPTCVNTGLTEGSHCSVCGEILTAQEVVDALGHDWTVATCKDPATCKVCGETTGEAIGHDTVSHEGKPATCLDNGYKTYETCSRCDYTTYEEIPALGHKPGAAKVENNVDPDCENDGSYDNVVYCTVCEEELSRVTVTVDALGHKPGEIVVENNVAPDCENKGSYDNVVYCTVCEKELSRETVTVDALGHKAGAAKVENNVDPDCENKGSYENVVYCTVCEKELSRETVTVDALGHKPGAEATCITAQTCTVCEAVLKDALGHAKVAHEAQAATCTAIGWEAYETCSRCDYSTYVEIPALGHDKVAHEAKAATCTAIGWEAYETCSRCDYSTYVEIPALGHTKVTHEAQAATCTAIGWEAYETCSRCDYSTYVEIPALGHAKVAHEAQAATCTAIGWEAYETCSRCDYSTYVEIPALGHAKVSHEAKAATCTAIGWKAYETCSRCDYSTYVEIPALGHTVVVDAAVAPDCVNTGLTEGSHCDVCKEVLVAQIVVPALGHTVVVDAAVAPDCVNTGLTEGSHCDVCKEVLVAQTVVDALGHTPGAEATCITAQTCTVCEAVLKDALGHDNVSHEAQAATCTAIGWEAYETCSRCDYTTYVEIPALGHNFSINVANINALDCDRCGVRSVIAQYTTAETVNMVTNTNNAKLIGLDSYLFNVVTNTCGGSKNGIGLNKDGSIRLYANTDGKGGSELGVTITRGKILSIVVTLNEDNQVSEYEVLVDGKEVTSNENEFVFANGADNVIIRNNQTSGQLRLDSIQIIYEVVACLHPAWDVATCIKPKTCLSCGATEGEKAAHTWVDATCTAPKTCSVCKATEGEPLGHNYVNGNCSRCGNEDPSAGGEEIKPVEATLSFADAANRSEYSSSKQVWSQNGITLTNTGSVGNYTNPIRLYANTKATISAGGAQITKIVLNVNASKYVSVFETSLKNAGVSYNTSGNTITIELASPVTEIAFTMSAQGRLNSIDVTYTPASTNPPVEECTHANTTETNSATCTEDGTNTVTCDDCKEIITTTESKALGHNFVDGTCTRCGEAESAGGEEKPATWVKASSIAVGDVVTLVCEGKTMEISGISTTSTKYGIGTAYTGTPTGTYALTVVAGSTAGTYAFKTSDGQYLSWSSGNSLTVSTTINANSSWSVSFKGGDVIITNAKDSKRKLQWNASSPRFACYTTSQTVIQMYKKQA